MFEYAVSSFDRADNAEQWMKEYAKRGFRCHSVSASISQHSMSTTRMIVVTMERIVEVEEPAHPRAMAMVG